MTELNLTEPHTPEGVVLAFPAETFWGGGGALFQLFASDWSSASL